jgi:NADPH2:quinone reductase
VVAAGVNFSDTRLRRIGMQTMVDRGGAPSWIREADLPVIPGGEVIGHAGGRRVLAICGTGGYAEKVAVPEASVFDVPDGIDDATALALFVQGLSAWHLVHDAAGFQKGESIAIQAAAGGVGSIAVQLARILGAASIVAVASTAEKQRIALGLGATAATDADPEGMADRLRDLNGGQPLDVVLEMTGGAAFDECLRVLAVRGRIVTYGTASGEPGTEDTPRLMAGSRAVLGFWLLDYMRDPRTTAKVLDELHTLSAAGELSAAGTMAFPLDEVSHAHAALESRETAGKVILTMSPGLESGRS